MQGCEEYMTEKELKRLSRADLLEMLIDQSEELQKMRESLHKAETELAERKIAIDEAGSIAEAALRLNGVFEAAQASCEQYMENIRTLSSRQEEISRQREEDSVLKAAAMLDETQKHCAAMESETKEKCARMVAKAKAESESYWENVHRKLEAYCEKHAEVRELLNTSPKISR